MLQLNNITKSYANSKRKILDDLSFVVNEGDSVAIVGPSGVGKSTLLNIMSTLDQANSGTVLWNSHSLNELSADAQADFRNQSMGFVFQQHQLLPQLSLLENVLVPTLPVKVKKKREEAKEHAMSLIEKVGLKAFINQKPGELSVGECQRTAVVRALVNKPQILFADEPTGSLDEESAEQLANLLVSLNQSENLALVMVTHARHIANKLKVQYLLQKGKLIQL